MVLEVLVWDHAAPLPSLLAGIMAEAWYKQGQEEEDMVSHHLLQEPALSDVLQEPTLFKGSPTTRGHDLGPVGDTTTRG